MAHSIARHAPAIDPKRHVKELKVWKNESNVDYAKYLVEVKLGHWENALRHFVLAKQQQDDEKTLLMSDDDFQICLQFIKEHNLYSLGLSLFVNQNQQEQRNSILYEFANFLLSSSATTIDSIYNSKIAINLYLSAIPPFTNEARVSAVLVHVEYMVV